MRVNESPNRAAAAALERRLAVGLTAANVAGGVLVFVFIGLVVPVPEEVHGDYGLLLRNLAVFLPGLVAAVVFANRRGHAQTMPVWDWYASGRAPTGRERAAALRLPLVQARLSAVIWTAAVVLFTVANAPASTELAALVAVTVALGGLSSCALTYLLGERLARPLTAAALSAEVPAEPAGPGVAARVLVAWSLTAGVPLLGAAMLAVAALTGANVTATQIAGTVLFLCVIGLAVGLAAMRLTARSIADPIESVRAGLRDVEAGNLSAEVPVFDGSEVGLLQAGFNRMAAGLEERERMRDIFGRHVGQHVAAEALRSGLKLGGEEREVAALFIDIVGSTRLATERSATEVVSVLNDFFAVVVAVTEANGGHVNKFEGDAALCVFGAPVSRPDAAADALTAAREMRARLRAEAPSVDVGIGVSAGTAVAGNVGAEERFEYTVIGDPINEAARLCELAKQQPGRVLASEAALQRAAGQESDRWSLGEAVTLRGRADPTRLATPSLTGSG